MHPSVATVFPEFSERFEGNVPSMYVDILGLVTCAIGCLIDPVSLALSLPWKHEKTGELATQAEISAAWSALKSQRAKYSKLHWRYAAALNDLRLDVAGVADVVNSRLLANEKILRGYFPNWDLFPSDAQLGLHSIGWAVGAGFPHTFGNLRSAANAQDWETAIGACAIRTDGNAGLIPRNAANRLCFANAAAVVARGLPIDGLLWPGSAENPSRSDEGLRVAADTAAAEHAAHNAALLDKLTTDLAAGLDLRHDTEPSPPPEDS